MYLWILRKFCRCFSIWSDMRISYNPMVVRVIWLPLLIERRKKKTERLKDESCQTTSWQNHWFPIPHTPLGLQPLPCVKLTKVSRFWTHSPCRQIMKSGGKWISMVVFPADRLSIPEVWKTASAAIRNTAFLPVIDVGKLTRYLTKLIPLCLLG